jgi:16S rRNA (cytosine967-C5)-methyltransferase
MSTPRARPRSPLRPPTRPKPKPARRTAPPSGQARPVSPRRAIAQPGRTPRITSLIVDSLSQALASVLLFDSPADVLMSRYFRSNPNLGSRDRSLVAEAIFFALRHYATLGWVLQPAQAARAPRLAALVTLALQHGFDALEERALRGDASAVKRALAIDLGRAPVSVRAELPHWLFLEFQRLYPDSAALIETLTEPAPLDLRVNAIKATRDAVLAEFADYGIEGQATKYSPDGIRLAGKPALTQWAAFREGRIEVQDEGSQLIARLVAPRRGEMVIDFCAGAGGKTLAMGALMRSSGRLYAFDVNARRLEGMTPRLKRSGLSNVHPVAIRSETDIRVKRLAGKCDRVLVDAPCSGSGTLRRNPDLKWRFDQPELSRVNKLQRTLLAAAARMVKPGGRIVYSTCSLLAIENQEVVEEFVAAHPEFHLLPAAGLLATQSIRIDHADRFAPYFVMLPHLHGTDGFFGAVLERS